MNSSHTVFVCLPLFSYTSEISVFIVHFFFVNEFCIRLWVFIKHLDIILNARYIKDILSPGLERCIMPVLVKMRAVSLTMAKF
jgi:hypothetical protein